ncbi:MAG: hypothetical protein J7L62_02375 [Candidatus Aminicenantes bacterium]|nr:hypothetical protein [Candidatus Aminicenantes bacterium]
MKIKKLFLPLLIMVGLGLLFQGCNKISDESTSGTKLIISRITGINWTDQESDVLYSDVVVQKQDSTTVQDDLARIYVIATPYSPVTDTTSVYYDIILSKYHVRYTRTDGRNVEGKDVPRSFWGSLTVRIPADSTEHDFAIVVVRSNAKMERPLVELTYGGGPKEIETDAEIELYGEDVAGHSVYAKGNLHIVFANYANESQ